MASQNPTHLPVIDAKDLCFKYTIDANAKRALTHKEIAESPLILSKLNFNLEVGNRVLLCGANGAGKSTLLEILAGRKRPTSGNVDVLGREAFHSSNSSVLLTASWADEISKYSSLPVLDLLQSSIKTAIDRCPKDLNLKDIDIYKEAIKKRGLALATLLEVDAAWITTELSEGQKRRVQLATNLVYPSNLILLDEVTAELDILTRRRLLKFLAKDCADRNATLIYCTHVFDGLSGFVNQVMQLSGGELQPLAPSLEGTGSVHAKVLAWLRTSRQVPKHAIDADRLTLAEALLGKEKAHRNLSLKSTEDSEDSDTVLSMTDFTWGYHGTAHSLVFKNASFDLKAGSRCILTGSNGCGKTTLLSVLGGGRIPVGYNDNNSLSRVLCVGVDPMKHHAQINQQVVHVSTAWRSRIASIVNGGAELSVQDISPGIIKHATRCVLAQAQDHQTGTLDESTALQVVTRRFEYLKALLEVQEQWVMIRVSSGQRARIQLCLQLLLPTKVVLMDEVTAELDVDTRHKLFEFLREESEGPSKVCVLYATHVLEGLDDWFTHILHLRKPRDWDGSAETETPPVNTLLLSKQNAMDSLVSKSDSEDGENDSSVLFKICLSLLLKERDEDLAHQKEEEVSVGVGESDTLSFRSTGPLLRAKADARILSRSDPERDLKQKLPTGWSYRTNTLPGGLGSHTWGIEEAEDLPPTPIADETCSPAPLPLPKIVVKPPPTVPPTTSVPPSLPQPSPTKSVDKPKSTVSPSVILPVLGQLEASVAALKEALSVNDVEAVAKHTASTAMMWKLMEPALNDLTGSTTSTTSTTSTSSSPFGSAPRGNTMSEAVLASQGIIPANP
mmetsp:Transcript_10177/g.12346  ORF Transcript_10177/g.12346 Transcript_10177/m.12346 type:complete len:844 (+) Transcript_10177:3-2534(+)